MAKPAPNDAVRTSVNAARSFYIVLYFLFYVSVVLYPNDLKRGSIFYILWYCFV